MKPNHVCHWTAEYALEEPSEKRWFVCLVKELLDYGSTIKKINMLQIHEKVHCSKQKWNEYSDCWFSSLQLSIKDTEMWNEKDDSSVTEDGVAVEAVIRGFPVPTGLTESNWCWISPKQLGEGVLWSSSVVPERG